MKAGYIQILHCSTKTNLADSLTKALAKSTFEFQQKMCGFQKVDGLKEGVVVDVVHGTTGHNSPTTSATLNIAHTEVPTGATLC